MNKLLAELIAAAKRVPEPDDEGFCESCGGRGLLYEHTTPEGYVAYRRKHKLGCWYGDLRKALDDIELEETSGKKK